MASKGRPTCVFREHTEVSPNSVLESSGRFPRERISKSQSKEGVGSQSNDENVLGEGAACGKAWSKLFHKGTKSNLEEWEHSCGVRKRGGLERFRTRPCKT